MRKFLSLLLSAALVLSLSLTAFAADSDTILAAPDSSSDIEAVVTEVAVGDNTAYVYAPENDWIVASTTTAPCFIVFGDEAYTEETAKAEAEASGLAELAVQEGAVVVFLNPQGDTWTDDDFDVYPTLVGMYSDSSTDTFENGIAESVNAFTGGTDTKILGGYQARIYLYAEGSGADFVAANYMKALVLSTTFGDGVTIEFDRTPTTVTLFNPTALPAAEEPASLAVAVVNGPEDAAEKLAGLTDEVVVDTSDVTEGFDAAWIADNYDTISGAFRSQVGVLLPMHDYAAEGIVEVIETYTYDDGTVINSVVFYDKDLDVTDSANPVPVVLTFHGGGETALSLSQKSEWPEIAQANGFIAVAVDNHVLLDAAKTVELLEYLESKYAIDATRVYGTGFSMGSVKSWDLFEQYPELFAGLAPMDGSFADTMVEHSDSLFTPVFFVGGQTSPLAELPYQMGDTAPQYEQIVERIKYAFKANSVTQEYSYNADVNKWWGVNGDLVYQVTDKVAFTDSTLTVNLFQSADGKYYTALADASNQSHEVYARNAWAAWDFLSQFSRNEDGTISIAPVTYTLASDDGEVTDNAYNTAFTSSYSDVDSTTPYAEAIEAVTKAGLMNGMGDGKFAPNDSVTRAQAVAVLYRLAGAEVDATSPFVDVADGAWYCNYVVWAHTNNIVGGYGDGRFGPNDAITSEQLDLILTRTAEDQGVEYTASDSTADTVTRADLANRMAQLYTALAD